MDNNQKLIEALNEAHNALERAINTLRNEAVPDLTDMAKRAKGNMAGPTAAQLIRDIIQALKAR